VATYSKARTIRSSDDPETEYLKGFAFEMVR